MPASAELEGEDWLVRAHRDLLTVQRCMSGEPPLGDAAAYHAQQAAEKALKALLASQGDNVPRIHDLAVLLALGRPYLPSLAGFGRHAAVLTPYAIAFRYLGGPIEPSVEDALEAAQLATIIVDAIQAFLSQHR